MKAGELRKYALSLPEAIEQPHFDFASFRVRGKIFVTLSPDEAHAHIFVDEQQRAMALDLAPDCAEPLFWGQKILGVRIALASAKPAFVKELVLNAWTNKAPKALTRAAV